MKVQRQANQHVLSQRREDSNLLNAENARHAQEIETLKARLAAAEAKNQQTSDAVFGNLCVSI